jgi:hypothetical protein
VWRPFEDVLAREILGGWPEELVAPDEVVWFHGTRLPAPTDFSDGLLPFKTCLPHLNDVVEQLARETGVPDQLLHKGEVSGSLEMKLTLRASGFCYTLYARGSAPPLVRRRAPLQLLEPILHEDDPSLPYVGRSAVLDHQKPLTVASRVVHAA